MTELLSFIYTRENEWYIQKQICLLGTTENLYDTNNKHMEMEPICGNFNLVIKVNTKELNNIENLLKQFLYEFIYRDNSKFYNNKIVDMIIPFLNTQNIYNEHLELQQINKILSNGKRVESCKKIGSIVKNRGHTIELEFMSRYNIDVNSIEYGACADASINNKHPITFKLLINLPDLSNNGVKPHCLTNLKVESYNVSIKSGKNIQFNLGNIPELYDICIDTLNNKDYVKNIFNKYLKKIESKIPADLLVYKDTDKWVFFKMNDIIDYISEKCIWRKLNTGRIKGDFHDMSKKKKRQYITYEYRPKHKSYFLGLNGNKGIDFINLLMNKDYGIRYYIDNIV